MRLQLTAATAAVLVAATGVGHADGTLSMRGVYYKERSTRVVQPMLDGMFEVGARGLVTAHFLVDAITSASAGSGAANAQPFTEKRYEAGGGYTQEFDGPTHSWIDRLRVGGDGKFSTESDYRSIYAGARVEADVAQQNATLGLGGGVSADRADNAGAQSPMGGPKLLCNNADKIPDATACSLTSYAMFASASQVLGKDLVIGATYDLAKLDGYQSNPYRQVLAGDQFVFERHPNERLRQAIAVSARYYVPASQTTFIAAYRYYQDDWRIHAHTPEVRIVQEVGSTADASLRYRYYSQDGAFFYAKRYDHADPTMNPSPYFTGDPKMSSYDGHLIEAKLGIFGRTFDLGGRWAGTRFEGILEYIVQHNRFGNAVVAHVAITVPFED